MVGRDPSRRRFLLGHHGAAFIDCVESRAAADESFARMLTGAQPYMMSEEVWARVQAVQAKAKVSVAVGYSRRNRHMELLRFALVLAATAVGFVMGFGLGWVGLGLVLVRAGRGGHPDLGLLYLSGAAAALLCAAGTAVATSRWLDRVAIRKRLAASRRDVDDSN